MASRKKKSFKFLKYMQKKMLIMFLLIFLLLTALVVRLMYIQQTKGSKYERIVLGQQGFDSQTIPFRRGDIYDAKGTLLATSEDVYNVIVDCKLIHEDKNYLEPTIQAVLTCFDDVTDEEIRTLLEERPDSQYYVLRKRLPYDKIQKFIEIQDAVYTEGKQKGEKINPNVKGIWFEKEYIRNYPYDKLACKVLGFTTSGNVGIGGLEDYYNDTLNGISGRQYGFLNSDNNFEKTIKDAVNGNSLVTTIDRNVQEIVERKIGEFDAAHRNEHTVGPGSMNTAVLVMNPNNGEIIAMADSTGYSLNDPWNDELLAAYCADYQGYTPEIFAALGQEAKLDMLNAMWQNFCITFTYEPGSTVKPLTVAAGLDTGKLTGEETYVCDGGEVVGPHQINCVNTNGHGLETLEQAIMNSCNDALMQIGFQIGVDLFCKYQNIFHIGLRTGIDLPGEARTDSLIYTKDTMGDVSLATNAFGQNYNMTMVQVASAFASVINGGYYYQPHLVKKIVDENGGTVQTMEPMLLKQTISGQTSDTVRGYLVNTVAAGTGRSAKVPGYSMGGKTGTAQKQPRENRKFLVSFIGFAPAENPQVLVYVVINEPNLENQAQSSMATNLAREIMAEIFPYLNIFPDEPVDVPEEGQAPEGGEAGVQNPEGGEGVEGGSPEGGEAGNPEGADHAEGSPEGGENGEGGVQNPDGGEGTGDNPAGDGGEEGGQGPGDGTGSPEGGESGGAGNNTGQGGSPEGGEGGSPEGADPALPPEEDYTGDILN